MAIKKINKKGKKVVKKGGKVTPKGEKVKKKDKEVTKSTENNNKKDIKKEADGNTTIIQKDHSDKVENVIKEGTPLDHAKKKVDKYVGMSKGVTVNMDNYESFRVDCWLSVPLEDSTPEERLSEISDIIEEQIEYEVTRIVNSK